MSFTNTIVGLRKTSLTVIASNGLRVNESGSILRHKSNRVRRIFGDQVLFATTFTEVCDEMIVTELNELLTKCSGDCRKASFPLGQFMASHPFLNSSEGEVALGSKDFLGFVDTKGGLVEPDEGFFTIGTDALLAAGAIKALLEFSHLEIEQIARESLSISANISIFGNDQIFSRIDLGAPNSTSDNL